LEALQKKKEKRRKATLEKETKESEKNKAESTFLLRFSLEQSLHFGGVSELKVLVPFVLDGFSIGIIFRAISVKEPQKIGVVLRSGNIHFVDPNQPLQNRGLDHSLLKHGARFGKGKVFFWIRP
jgi:hypothetical protein